MHIIFLSDTMKFSGGRKKLFEYANYLRSTGRHNIEVLVQRKEGDLKDFTEVTVVPDYSPYNIPECDIIVATTPKEVKFAYQANKGIVVHFCQGFEITDLEQRVAGNVVPLRYQNSGIFTALRLFRKKFSWKRKIKKIDKIYSHPYTYIITVSSHLKKQLEKRYKKEVFLVVNGVDNNYFFPSERNGEQEAKTTRKVKVINVGPMDVTFKGIETTLKVIEKAKNKNIPIHFTRVTPKVLQEERSNPIIDSLYENISQKELGDLFRGHDIYISNSTEGEGFGLPAMEALSCGLICILSNISSYKSFGPADKNFCLFVKEGDVDSTLEMLKLAYEMSEKEKAQIRKNALEVARNYTKEKSYLEFEAVLEEILGENTETRKLSLTFAAE